MDMTQANHKANIRAYQREAEQLSTDEIVARLATAENQRRSEIEELEKKLGFDDVPYGYKPESQAVGGTTAYNAWDNPSLEVLDGGQYKSI